MRYEDRVPDELVRDGHYLGRPADFTDKIITRRVNLVKQIPGFCGKAYDLLDIGCGNGASSLLLSGEMHSVLGIDVESTHQPEFENYKREHGITNCDFRLHNIEQTPLERQFDRIISFEVIEHLSNDHNVRNYYNALKPGGMIAITVPNKWWIFETHGAKLPLLPWNRVPFFSWLPRPIHERFANARIYTSGRIVKLMTDCGFQVMDVKLVTAPMDVLKEGKLKDFVVNNIFNSETTSNPMLAVSVFVVARRVA
jgi:2-polyprenyl-3-methyl-5-hydroxy-6-metoxy-1,4-benzoquinol methylase